MEFNSTDHTQLCRQIRLTLCQISASTRTPHLACCLSGVEILVSLYFQFLRINPKHPDSLDRDYFLLSKGHAASLLYTTLAYRGFFNHAQLFEHGQLNSCFEEHPGLNSPPGVEQISGSLGHGLPIAAGMALATKMREQNNRFVVLMGDGEQNEGTVWEAALFAQQHQLHQLTAIIDANGWQGTGRTQEVMNTHSLQKKYHSFGWQSLDVNGHNLIELQQALAESTTSTQPTAIIAHTTKGRGISFMEDDNNWHYRIPTAAEIIQIQQELELT